MAQGQKQSSRKLSPPDKLARLMTAMERQGTIVSLTLLRLGVGVIMTVHGGMKLADTQTTISNFSAMGIPFAEVSAYLATAGELLGGLGLIFGLLTRLAALGPAFTMIGAIGFVHLGNGLLAKNNGWEFPLTLLLVSLVFAVRGAGPFSVDALIAKKRGQSEDKSRSHRSYGQQGESVHGQD